MNGRNPTKAEQDWLDQIVQIGCIVCHLEKLGATPAEVHHINGSRKPGANFDTIPLCFLHHRSWEDVEKYTSRHPFKKRFVHRYGSEEYLLSETKKLVEKANGKD